MLVAAVCTGRRGSAGRLSVVAVEATAGGLVPVRQARRRLAPEVARAPVFSPDGRWIAFVRGGDVTLASLADPAAEPAALAPAFGLSSASAHQFDASSSWIALALERGVLVVPTAGDAGGCFVPLPEGHRPDRLLWSERGGLLAVTAREPDGSPVAVVIDPARSRVLATSPGVEVLGVPDDETVWLVGPRAGLPGGEAFVWRRGGEATSSFVCPDDYLILSWVPRQSAVLLAGLAEDAGDPADVAIASLAGGEPRPLIHGVPGVCDIAVSSDGGWVTFLSEEDPMASYLVSTASAQPAPQRVLVEESPPGGAEEVDADPELLVEVACVVTPVEGAPWPS